MKLGTENRTMVIVAAVLVAVALISMGRMLWPSAPESAPAPVVQQTSAANLPRPVIRTSSGRLIRHSEPRLDPTLDLDLLRQSEQIKYAGTGRNIFVNGPPPIEAVVKNPALDKRGPQPPPAPAPPPPITLKFYGFASEPGEPKKIFLSQGDDIFVASEGDIVDRKYRILHINPTSVDVEDVLNNNRQNIPLTQS